MSLKQERMASSPRVRNRRTKLLAVLVVAAGSGCTQLPPHMRQELTDADREYVQGDLTGATRRLDAIIQQYPIAVETAEAHYLRALCRIKQGRPGDAMADLQQCVKLSQRGELTGKASAALGGLQQDAGQWGLAADSYQKALQNLPNKPPADEVLLRRGMCLQREGRWNEAREAFSTLINRHPSSAFIEDARRRFSWKFTFFSIQCGAFTRPSQADGLVRKLKSALSEAWVEPEARYGRPMYVVYAGKYGSYAQADAGLRAARKVTPEAFIVP
jgi:tetratricopeptide (TPR) repeat protein